MKARVIGKDATGSRCRPTLLGLPSEIRKSIYEYIPHEEAVLQICGYKHRCGHGKDEHTLRHQKRQVVLIDKFFEIAYVCRLIREEVLPILLSGTVLRACHFGARLVDKVIPFRIRQHIQLLSMGTSCFNSPIIRSLRPDVPHRRCKALPTLPNLRHFILFDENAIPLAPGLTRADLDPQKILQNGKILLERIIQAEHQLLLLDCGPFLAELLLNTDRSFSIEIAELVGDLHARRSGQDRGFAAVSSSHPCSNR
jgi:hypothetical protein